MTTTSLERRLRWSICELSLLLVGAVSATTEPPPAAAQLPARDRIRLVEAMRLAEKLTARLWPTWGRTSLSVLFVTDSAEFLIGHPRPSSEFVRLDQTLGRHEIWTRPRQFSPTLLATFPAVGGVPTVVIGSAERTNKSSTSWVLTLLHEHFHQWQYSQPDYYRGVARLDLAQGDTTGRWMLEYPFPYDSKPVRRAMRRLANALARALDASPDARVEGLQKVIAARDALRGCLEAADYRYFEFQIWQEGVARFMEYAAAREAGELTEPSTEFRSLPDYEPYKSAAREARDGLRRELERLDLAHQQRIAFYPVGAAMALLLEQTRRDWKQAYAERPFALAALLTAGR